jgi:hypothetical protein
MVLVLIMSDLEKWMHELWVEGCSARKHCRWECSHHRVENEQQIPRDRCEQCESKVTVHLPFR